MRFILTCVSLAFYLQAQPGTFTSTSTGADGALTYAPNLGTVYFPPSTLGMRPNNIYNFSTITVGQGTSVRLSGWVLNGPVYWLATGDVNISGTIDLTGQPGYAPGSASVRAPSEPGAGGYSGGLGVLGSGQNATAGNGPGGGAAPGKGGSLSGSSYLIPLVGGSGGGGNSTCAGGAGGGGAGGGALLIASSTQIIVTWVSGGPQPQSFSFRANGGPGGACAGGGSGGAIRLAANTISINNAQFTLPGGSAGAGSGGSNGGPGSLRLEAYTINGTTGFSAQCCVDGGANSITSTPHNVALPTGGTSVLSVTSINGVSINANPFNFPDATVATSSPVPVVISGTNIPPNTTGTLYIFSETSADQAIPFTLTGTFASTSATVNVPYPSGGSRGFAKAIWVSP